MSHDIRPGWLLCQSRELAVKPGRGRPRTADLRRSISAAYYAVFHRLSRCLSEAVAPNGVGERLGYELCRIWQHGDFKQVCSWITDSKRPPSQRLYGLVAVAQSSPELVRVAENFRTLIDARHDADYNHLVVFRRRDAIGNFDIAERTLADLERIPRPHPAWRAFVTLVLIRTKIA